MATRAERMKDRIRGAGHGQVGEVSFHIDLGADDGTTSEESSPESTAKTPTAPRNKTASNIQSAPRSSPSEPRTAVKTIQNTAAAAPASIGRRDPYDLREKTPEATTPVAPSSAQRPRTIEDDVDDLALPVAQSTLLGSARSAVSRSSVSILEEVSESPLKAPGTGQRRQVRPHDVSSSSMRLQQIIEAEDDENEADPLSSPSEQRTQRARASLGRPKRSPLAAEAEEPDELSPEQTTRSIRRRADASPELSSPPKRRKADPTPTAAQEEPEVNSPSSPVEASKRSQGRKRRNQTTSQTNETAVEEEISVARQEGHEPEPDPERERKRRRREKTSPAKQKQGRPKASSIANTAGEAQLSGDVPARKPRRKKSAAEENGNDIIIHAQRFTKRRRVADGEDPDFDIITAEIPHAKRAGVNCIDVLSSLCHDVIDTAIEALQGTRRHAVDAASRKEIQVKTQALEAFQAELKHHFLDHTIRVDHMHSLRQRVKSEQKEKSMLRDEIMRIRAEREHVAMRKDAIRAKHEKRREETMSQLDLSSALHDIDLAVDRGRQAEDLSPAQEKKADLASLELLVSRLTEQGSSKSDTGGSLSQLKEFNAFLERAAAALEGR